MPVPRIYSEEACPLEGYADLRVRVLANTTDAEWKAWIAGNLGVEDCDACATVNESAPAGRRYCDSCTQTRATYGRSIVLFYGPRLLDEDVSTVEAALALFDDDDRLPREIVVWLQLLPGIVRTARIDRLFPNSNGSLTTPST